MLEQQRIAAEGRVEDAYPEEAFRRDEYQSHGENRGG